MHSRLPRGVLAPRPPAVQIDPHQAGQIGLGAPGPWLRASWGEARGAFLLSWLVARGLRQVMSSSLLVSCRSPPEMRLRSPWDWVWWAWLLRLRTLSTGLVGPGGPPSFSLLRAAEVLRM